MDFTTLQIGIEKNVARIALNRPEVRNAMNALMIKELTEAVEWCEDNGLLFRPFIPEYNQHNAHMYYIILPTGEIRDKLLKYLKENEIQAVFHYIPLHSSPMGQKLGYKAEDLPITEEYSARLLRLPMYTGLEEEKVEYIVDKIHKFFKEV